MDYKIWSHILLELAIEVSVGGKNLQELFRKALPAFLRKLNCNHVAVITRKDGFFEPVYSVPEVMIHNQEFQSIVNRLQMRELENMEKEYFQEASNIYFYAFPLKTFGILILRRSIPIDRALFEELTPVMEIFGNTCIAIQETLKREEMDAYLSRKIDFQRVLMELATGFINISLDNYSWGIQSALEKAGSFTQVDRAYMFDYDFEKGVMNNTFEWCNAGVSAEIENLQGVPMHLFQEDWVNPHMAGQIVHIPDVEMLDKSGFLYEILHPQGIRTLITLPLIYQEQCLGFIGFDVVGKCKEWKEDDVALLRVLAELFTNAKIRQAHDRELLEAKINAEMANRGKSEFLANMSHEIRTSLNGIVSTLYLLEDTSLTVEQREYLRMTNDSLESLLTVIGDILDFSKIEAGKMDLYPQKFNLEEEIYKVAGIFGAKASEKGIDLIPQFQSSTTNCVLGDRMRIRQILLNLVSNAIKFTDEGHVIISCQVFQDSENTAKVYFSVEDTGVGIPLESQKEIFSQFTQVDSSSTKKVAGTGLGLTISRELVAMMGGDLGVESKIGKGSLFSFTLPLPACEYIQEETPDYGRLAGTHALVVDDNLVNRNVFEDLLKRQQVHCICAAGAREAMEILDQSADQGRIFDFIIIDFAMPETDGLYLGKIIRNDSRFASSKLVMVSSNVGKMNIREVEAAGFQSLLFKPLAPNDFYRTLYQCRFSTETRGSGQEEEILHIGGDVSLRTAWERERQSKLQVLLVDDHKNNRKVARLLMEKMACQVTEAENGYEAISLVKQKQFDVIFMDIQMPGMDGYETAKKIRLGCPTCDSIPIVALTANALNSDREKSLEAGMQYHLSKPFARKDLERILDEYRKPKEAFAEKKEEHAWKFSSLPVFDGDELWKRYEGDKELIQEIADSFFLELPGQLERLEMALIEKNPADAEHVSHNLKGSFGYAGSPKLMEAARMLLVAVRGQDWEEAKAFYRVIQGEAAVLENSYRRWHQTLQ